ncbi:MAG: glycosyl hydrolase-related protein, partial [Phycisphaerae bacterium]
DKGSQCPGKNRFRYAVMPHEGDWVKAGLWQAAERFNLPFAPAQMGITSHGREPLTKSFLELDPAILHVSAVKQSQDAQGWVVRLFNPLDCSVQGRIRLNGGKANPSETFSPVQRVQKEFALPEPNDKPWRKIRETTLEEIPVADLAMDSAGWVDFTIGKKKIMTLEFRP